MTFELGEDWYTACGSGPQSRMGTVVKDAFVYLAAQMTEGATFYDIGAGYGLRRSAAPAPRQAGGSSPCVGEDDRWAAVALLRRTTPLRPLAYHHYLFRHREPTP